MQHDNVTINEGPIPVAAQKRAVEHLRERTKALVLRERSTATGALAAPLQQSGPVNLVPQINSSSLPSVWKDMPPLKDAEEAPTPAQIDRAHADKLPKLVEEIPPDQVFPDSELPGGSTKPAATPATVPATTVPLRGKSKPPARTTGTFGTMRFLDGPATGSPSTPVVAPAVAPAGPALPAPPTTGTTSPVPSGTVNPPSTSAQSLLPLP